MAMVELCDDAVAVVAEFVDGASAARASRVCRAWRRALQPVARVFIESLRAVTLHPLTSFAERLDLTESARGLGAAHGMILQAQAERHIARARRRTANCGCIYVPQAWYVRLRAFLETRQRRIEAHCISRSPGRRERYVCGWNQRDRARVTHLIDHDTLPPDERLSLDLADRAHYPGSPNIVVLAGQYAVVAVLCPNGALHHRFHSGRALIGEVMGALEACASGTQRYCQVCSTVCAGPGPCAHCREDYALALFHTVARTRALLRTTEYFGNPREEQHLRVPLRLLGHGRARKRKRLSADGGTSAQTTESLEQ